MIETGQGSSVLRPPSSVAVQPAGDVDGERRRTEDGGPSEHWSESLPLLHYAPWQARFPWLVQATSGVGDPERPFDLGLWGGAPAGEVLARWEEVRVELGMRRIVTTRQVHGRQIVEHSAAESDGLLVQQGYDGHLTDAPGLLLSVSVADCVPVFLVEARSRSVALLHAGWRGVAAGIVEAGVERLRARGESDAEIWAHAGPAICGGCYEVGPEVHAAVRPLRDPPPRATPIDLRAAIGERLRASGVTADRVSTSRACTLCGGGRFFSHRGGATGRQMGLLGIRRD